MFAKTGPVYKLIVQMAKAGCHIKDIAEAADVSKNTVYSILRKENAVGLISVKRHRQNKQEQRERRAKQNDSKT